MRIRLALFLHLLLVHAAAQAADVNSRIDAVIVYPFGATVTRVADIDLQQGANEVRLAGLVSSVDINQLQLELADSGVRIGQIKVLREPQREAYNDEIVDLESRIYIQNRRIQTLDDSSNAARLRLKFLEGVAQGTAADAGIEGRRGTADVNSWREALDLLQTAYVDANTLIRDNDASKVELVKEVSVLKRQRNELRGRSLASSIVELTLEASNALQTTLRLHYFQANANWSARYESRLNSATGELQLTQQADVNQQTDEAWNNVRLTLSTSDPGGQLIAPGVVPEFLTLVEPAPVARDRDIEVDIPRSATPADESDIDNKPGVVLWKKTLEPGETWRIRHQYTIRYPTDRVLQRVN